MEFGLFCLHCALKESQPPGAQEAEITYENMVRGVGGGFGINRTLSVALPVSSSVTLGRWPRPPSVQRGRRSVRVMGFPY